MEQKNGKMRAQPKQTRSLLRVEHILASAAAVFAEFGYDNATTNEIARRADTSIGALYRFFPDKKAIFSALAQSYLVKVGSLITLEIIPKISATDSELVLSFLDLCDRFVESEPAFGAVFVYSDASPELKDIDRHMKRSIAKLLSSLLRKKNSLLSKAETELVARICVEISAAYFRLTLSEPEISPACRKESFHKLLTAYLNLYTDSHES